MQIPRDETLVEMLYKNIEQDEYLNEIYNNLLYNYSLKLFKVDKQMKNININHALRFADLLSKSTYEPKSEMQQLWGQEIAILLNLIYPQNNNIRYYLGEILSTLGNYRGLKADPVKEFESLNLFDNIYYEYDKEKHLIPGKEDEYFFPDQKNIYDNLGMEYFSYSGPTSMGKSFVVQTYIEEQIKAGSTKNYAILVPTKALINEVKSNIIKGLTEHLKYRNYRVVSSSGDFALKQEHHFVFVMTPERLLHLLISSPDIQIDFLFIDEAHKISERGGRSTYYYKVVSQINSLNKNTKTIFASPNIPNPEIYLNIIPKSKNIKMHKLAAKYSPVCQFKYYIDFIDKNLSAYNEYSKTQIPIEYNFKSNNLSELVEQVGSNSQNLIYCGSKRKVLELAIEYAHNLPELDNEKLRTLSKDIKNEVHENCYLADLILKGVAYHVGYLPSNIRLRIEKSFEEGDLKTIFCTSTLIEGINLPADNLFVTSYKNGNANMDEVEFRNLVGRVGRIKYNLYGNVFLVRDDDKLLDDKYIQLLKNDVPEQVLSIENKNNRNGLRFVIDDLKQGDLELSQCHEHSSEKDYSALRNFSMILTRDISQELDSPLKQAFVDAGVLDKETEQCIKNNFPNHKTSDDITLSYDQAVNLKQAIANDLSYPHISDENDNVEFEEVVSFMMKLRKIFKWDIYERKTIGKKGTRSEDSVIRWYSLLLLRWIEGNGLNRIIYYSLKYKADNPHTGVWIGNYKLADYYYKESKLHQNYIIAETLGDIENVLLYSISNYFRKFSIEYKKYHNVDSFKNDWYEYVEYGTTNPITMFLQQTGFSRQIATFIKSNQQKYLVKINGDIKIKRSILTCGNLGVETEANDIQFNMPELFIN